MQIILYTIAIAAVILNFIIIELLWEKRKERPAIYYIFAMAIGILWQAVDLLTCTFDLGQTSVYIWRIVFGLSLFVNPLLFFFVLDFLEVKLSKLIRFVFFAIVFICASIIWFSGLAISGLEANGWKLFFGQNLKPGAMFDLFGAYYFIFFLLFTFFLFRVRKKTEDQERIKQIKIFIVGIVATLVVGIVIEALRRVGYLHYHLVSSIPAVILPALVSSAIFGKKFLDIKPKKWTLRKRIFSISLLLTIVLMVGYDYYLFYRERSEYTENTNLSLEAILDNKADWLNLYFGERKKDLALLTNTIEIKRVLSDNQDYAKRYDKEQAKKEVEDLIIRADKYLSSNPEIISGNPLDNRGFRAIVTQGVGQAADIFVYDSGATAVSFPKSDDSGEAEAGEPGFEPPKWWMGAISAMGESGRIDGIYPWVDPDGVTSDKYIYAGNLKNSIMNGTDIAIGVVIDPLDLASSVYSQNENSDFLREYLQNYDYLDLYIITSEGRVLWTAQGKGGGSENILSIEGQRTLADLFQKTKKEKVEQISDIELDTITGQPVFYVAVPIIENGDFLGEVILQVGTEVLYQGLGNNKSYYDSAEVYLVGEDKFMRSPSKFIPEDTVLKLTVDNENITECLEDVDGAHRHKGYIYLGKDYHGVPVVGTHRFIPYVDMCLIAKVDQAEIFKDLEKMKNDFIALGSLSLLLVILVLWYISHIITKPLKELVTVAKEYAKGNFRYQPNIKSSDEYKILADALSDAGIKLEQVRMLEAQYQTKLEKEVSHKTEELEKLVRKMEAERKELENQKLATFNILEDTAESNEKLKEITLSLSKKKFELESLKSLGDEITGIFSLEEVISTVNKYLDRILDYSAATFLVINPFEKGDILFRTYLKKPMSEKFFDGVKKELMRYLSYKSKGELDEDIRILESLKPKIFGAQLDNSVALESAATFVLPFGLGKNVLGALHITSFESEFFKKKESKEFIKAMISTLSVAVARLQTITKHQSSRTESLVNSLSNGVIMFNAEKRIELINPAASKITASIRKDYNIKGLSKLFVDLDLQEKINESLGKDKIIQINETKIEGRFYEIYIIPIKDLKNIIVGGAIIFHDITYLKEIDQMKTEFVSVASHQLRTPLTAIKLFTGMLAQGQVGKLNKEQQEYLDNIYQSTERMVRLVNDLLNVTRIESGRLKIDSHPVDLQQFIQSIIDEAKPLSDLKNQKLVFTKPKTKIPKVPLDQNLMRQVVHNLIVNAIRYSPKEKGKIGVSLRKQGRNHFLITVKDNGLGIPEKAQKRIFEKFFRADNAVKSVTEGTGLGLYVSRMIVEQSGGEIWFATEENKGTSFYVKMPMRGMKSKEGERTVVIS